MTTPSGNQSLRLVRRLAITPERAFDALVNPDLLRKWMFTEPETSFDMDLRVGGEWSITTRREGVDYTASGTYLEVNRPSRLVYTFGMLQFSPNSDTITVEIAPDPGGCIMTFTQSGVDIAEELRQLAPGEKGGSEQGYEQGFDALAAALG